MSVAFVEGVTASPGRPEHGGHGGPEARPPMSVD